MPRKSPPRELPELDCDMTPADIAFELQQLRFDGGNHAYHQIKIDRDVRDYLLTALSTRHATRRD